MQIVNLWRVYLFHIIWRQVCDCVYVSVPLHWLALLTSHMVRTRKMETKWTKVCMPLWSVTRVLRSAMVTEKGKIDNAFLKIWNASRICVSSLRRGHANLLCIVPILVYVLPKQAHIKHCIPCLFIEKSYEIQRACGTHDACETHSAVVAYGKNTGK